MVISSKTEHPQTSGLLRTGHRYNRRSSKVIATTQLKHQYACFTTMNFKQFSSAHLSKKVPEPYKFIQISPFGGPASFSFHFSFHFSDLFRFRGFPRSGSVLRGTGGQERFGARRTGGDRCGGHWKQPTRHVLQTSWGEVKIWRNAG